MNVASPNCIRRCEEATFPLATTAGAGTPALHVLRASEFTIFVLAIRFL